MSFNNGDLNWRAKKQVVKWRDKASGDIAPSLLAVLLTTWENNWRRESEIESGLMTSESRESVAATQSAIEPGSTTWVSNKTQVVKVTKFAFLFKVSRCSEKTRVYRFFICGFAEEERRASNWSSTNFPASDSFLQIWYFRLLCGNEGSLSNASIKRLFSLFSSLFTS